MIYNVSIAPIDYVECVGFTTYVYLSNKIVKRDLMKGSERSLGEFLEHFIRGKLAEFAFKIFLKETLKIETLIDVDLPVFIEGEFLPDILAFKTSEEWNIAKFWVEIKAVTGGHRWMLVPTTSVTGGKRTQPRPYCAYVNCHVDLPQDHVARLIKYAPEIAKKMSPEWKEKLADIEGVNVSILGYALYEDINNILSSSSESAEILDKVFGPGNWRYLKKRTSFKDLETGKQYGDFGRDNCVVRLTRLRQDWDKFATLLKDNKPLAPEEHRDLINFEKQMVKAIDLMSKQPFQSWFARNLNEQPISSLNKWFKK